MTAAPCRPACSARLSPEAPAAARSARSAMAKDRHWSWHIRRPEVSQVLARHEDHLFGKEKFRSNPGRFRRRYFWCWRVCRWLGDWPTADGSRGKAGPRWEAAVDDDGRISWIRSSPGWLARAKRVGQPGRLRSFDPSRVADLECAAWVAYYRRRWLRLLAVAVGLARAELGMSWPRTVRAAWFALRAIQLWAPLPANDPERARRYMRRFYLLVQATHGQPRDPAESARLEIEWWRVHRAAQQVSGARDELADALARLYACVFGVPESDVRPAAVHRCRAMEISDQWVTQGMRPDSPLLAWERTVLVRSHTALLAAVSR